MNWAVIAFVLSGVAVNAAAAEFPLGLEGAKPAASITVPDEWKPKYGPHGVEGASPDGSAFIVVKMLKAGEKAAADYNEETMGYLQEQGVRFPALAKDEEPETTDTDTKINGLDTFVSRLEGDTVFKGMPAAVTYYAIPFGETQTLNIITRGPSGDKSLPAIVATVKPLP